MGNCVYFIQSTVGGPIKIGHSSDLAARLVQMQSHCPFPLVVLCTMPGGRVEEHALHVQFAADLSHGEWFTPSSALAAHIETLGGSARPVRTWDPALDVKLATAPVHVLSSLRVKVHLSIGPQVRTLRLAQGLSQEELSVRAGLDRNEVGKLESGVNLGTRRRKREALARGFGLSPDDFDRFLGGTIDVFATMTLIRQGAPPA
jgi:hypothetical protein